MIRLWRMRKFVRIERKLWGNINDDINLNEFDNVPIKDVKVAYKKKRKYMFWHFNNKDANKVYIDLIQNKYGKPTTTKGVPTLDITWDGMKLSDFSGYLDELIKWDKRLTAVVVGILALIVVRLI